MLRRLSSPLFQKEMIVAGRKRFTYFARAAMTLLLLAFTSFAYLGMRNQLRYSGSVERLQIFAGLAPLVTVVVGWVLFFALIMVAPVLTAPTLADERRKGTLGALLTTPLSSFQIAWGKLAGHGVQLLILALLCTPILLAIRVFGGVETRIIVGVLAVPLSAAVLAACLGMFYSAWVDRPLSAIISAFVTLAGLMFLGPLLAAVLVNTNLLSKAGVGLPAMLATSGPLMMAGLSIAAMEGGGGGPIPGPMIEKAIVICTTYHLSLTGIVFLATTASLRRTMLATGVQAPALARAMDGKARSRTIGDHPVYWREIRQPVLRRRWMQIVLGVLIVGGLVAVHASINSSERDDFLTGSTAVGVILSLFVAAVSTAGGITGERESRTLDSLLTTPMSAREIVWGKFLGSLRRGLVLPMIVVVHLLVGGVITGELRGVVLPAFVLLAPGPIALLSATGVWFSSTSKKSVSAAVWNLAFALLIWLAPFIVLGIVFGLLLRSGGRWDDYALSAAAIVNPVAMGVVAVLGCRIDYGNTHAEFDLFDFASVGSVAFLALCAAFLALYGLASWLSLQLAARALASRTLRRR